MVKITPEKAASILGKSPQFVRVGLQNGSLPIGSAVKMSTMYTYHISAGLLAAYLGCTVKDIERMVSS